MDPHIDRDHIAPIVGVDRCRSRPRRTCARCGLTSIEATPTSLSMWATSIMPSGDVSSMSADLERGHDRPRRDVARRLIALRPTHHRCSLHRPSDRTTARSMSPDLERRHLACRFRCSCIIETCFETSGRVWYSRRILLPSTTPQPAAASAGSMCSARVSASFMRASGVPSSRPADRWQLLGDSVGYVL